MAFSVAVAAFDSSGDAVLAAAEDFLGEFHSDRHGSPQGDLRSRLVQVRGEIAETGTYRHTAAELTWGARVAWRNSARCIGRLYWPSLRVRDRRFVTDPRLISVECAQHLRGSFRDGTIRPTVTVFAPDRPDEPAARIHNDQLIRYAAYRAPDGSLLGDPSQEWATDLALSLGWQAPRLRSAFDVLPLMIGVGDERPEMFSLPDDAVHEVPLTHPDFPWFADLGLRWHAIPAISNMPLEIGGITYPAAPFNGWYMSSEIGARNLADPQRYDLVPAVAEHMGLDTSCARTMWRDRAVVELTVAVQHSFDAAGIRVTDHHTESERFLTHIEREEAEGRTCPADWSWIVPPISGSQTPVFHRYYDEPAADLRPAFLPAPPHDVLSHAAIGPSADVARCPVAHVS